MYPNNHQYKVAIANKYYAINRNPGLVFEAVMRNGEPKFERGNKAVVFNVIDNNNAPKAIKLFFTENKHQKEKFQSLNIHLRSYNNPSIIDFKYVNDFIYCDVNSDEKDNYFPGLIMDWVEGQTLGTLVKALTKNKEVNELKKLTEKFKELSLFIIDSDFGHGDLKHDNIIVDADLNMKLIDYDGMYIPDFKGQKSGELGTPSFQHPNRKSKDFNAQIDDFSILSIYTSLLALSKFPNLYEKYEDQQNLLFRLEDFEKPAASELFQFLDKDIELAKWSYLLKKSLENDHIYIPELKNYLDGTFPKPSINISHFPEKFISGSEIEIQWKTENVDEVFFINKLVDINGAIKTNVYPNSRFTFKIKNHFETIEFEYKITVLPELKIKEFRSKQQKIEHGKETQIVWDIDNAEKIELHWLGNMEIVPNKGEKTISPTDHTNYKLIVTALDGVTKEEKEITIQVFKRVEIKSFVSDLEFVVESLPIKLSWEIENASIVTLSSNMQSDIDVTGKNEIVITSKKTSYFYLKASNELFSQNSEQIKIEVQNIPVFNPSVIPRLPQGKDLIPSFDLDFNNISDNILTESQLGFKSAMKSTKRFSLLHSLQKIFK